MTEKVKEPIDPKSVDPNAPLRLSTAAEIAFPFGGMKVSGLRREIARGTLEAEIIAGKLYVSLNAIEHMRERCREPVRARVEQDRRIVRTMQEMRAADKERRSRITDAAALGMTEAELATFALRMKLKTLDDEHTAQTSRAKKASAQQQNDPTAAERRKRR